MSERTLQDPSAPMKRAMFRALAIGAIAVILYMFCVQPSQSSLDKAKADLAGLEAQQGTMMRDLKDAIDAERKEFLAGLLKPMLGSYAMRAKSVLDPLATDVGLRITDYAEMPVRLLPLPKPQAAQLYARKPIRLTCTGSYATIVSFLMRVEKKLPLVSLEAFSLKTQKDPDNQTATLVFEWPVKGVNTAAAAKGGVKK